MDAETTKETLSAEKRKRKKFREHSGFGGELHLDCSDPLPLGKSFWRFRKAGYDYVIKNGKVLRAVDGGVVSNEPDRYRREKEAKEPGVRFVDVRKIRYAEQVEIATRLEDL